MTPDTGMRSKECYGEFCCDFEYSFKALTTDKPRYHFALAVYHGNRTFDGFADGGVYACAVLACQTREVATCGVRNETLEFNYEWYKLVINGVFPYGDQFIYFPTTLDTSIMPFEVNEYSFLERVVIWEK